MDATAVCQGGLAFAAVAGWNTYELNLTDRSSGVGLPVSWSGSLVGLGIVGGGSGHIDVDYIRLTSASGDSVEIQGGPTIDPRPVAKLDWATAAGNPWDMDGFGDIAQQIGLKPGSTIRDNQFRACSLGTSTNQFPGIMLNMPGGRSIDASRFRTLTFEYSYDGEFSTRPVAGGGAFARVFWFDPSGNRHPTAAIHRYPNENVVQVRLDDPRAIYGAIEPGKGATGASWSGRVTQFRISPNDTRDSRCFSIGRVWLASDDPANTVIDLAPATSASTTPSSVTTRPTSKTRTTTKRTTTKRTTRTTVKKR